MKLFKHALLAGALILSGARPALAGEFRANYSGTVSAFSNVNSSSLETLFGYGSTNIVGSAFSATVNYITDVAGSAFFDDVYGGSGVVSNGGTPVISSVVFTVNNDPAHSFTFTPNYYANVESAAAGFHQSAGYDTQGDAFQAFIVTDSTPPGDVATPFTMTGTGFDPIYDIFNYVSNDQETLTWDVTKVSVTSAAPEPKTWAFLMTGIGFIGLALRRRVGQSLPMKRASSWVSV